MMMVVVGDKLDVTLDFVQIFSLTVSFNFTDELMKQEDLKSKPVTPGFVCFNFDLENKESSIIYTM